MSESVPAKSIAIPPNTDCIRVPLALDVDAICYYDCHRRCLRLNKSVCDVEDGECQVYCPSPVLYKTRSWNASGTIYDQGYFEPRFLLYTRPLSNVSVSIQYLFSKQLLCSIYMRWLHVALSLRMRDKILVRIRLLNLKMRRSTLTASRYHTLCHAVLAAHNGVKYGAARHRTPANLLTESVDRETSHKPHAHTNRVGGGTRRNCRLSREQLNDHLFKPFDTKIDQTIEYIYTCYVDAANVDRVLEEDPRLVATQLPLEMLATCLSVEEMRFIGQIHGIPLLGRGKKVERLERFRSHHCVQCNVHFSMFATVLNPVEKKEKERLRGLRR